MTWFVDPPYQHHAPGVYQGGTKGFDYANLAALCKSARGQVIVCESPHKGKVPDWLPFRVFSENTGGGPRAGSRAKNTELIWTNR